MSLFYSRQEVRLLNSKKRKKGASFATEDLHHEKYSCDWCLDEYESETELHIHKRLKHTKNVKNMLLEQAVCKTCISREDTPEKLLQHIKSAHLLSSEDSEHVEREIFICDICHQLFFNKQMLIIHMQHIHDLKNKHKMLGTCPMCKKVVPIKHIWFHFQRHMIQSVACCPICFKKCRNRKDLKEHVKVHANYYYCNNCGYNTRVKDHFTTHMQAHNSNLHLSKNIAIDETLLWKCFMPRKISPISIRNEFNYGIKGLRLLDVCVCVLCRGICTEGERAGHIAKYHLVDIVPTKKQYTCVCGEQFFNSVLLKHHVFKLQGHHKAHDT